MIWQRNKNRRDVQVSVILSGAKPACHFKKITADRDHDFRFFPRRPASCFYKKQRDKRRGQNDDDAHNNGRVVIIVLLLLVAFTILGTAVVVLSVYASKLADRERRAEQAIALAQAGVKRALIDLRQDFLHSTGNPSWTDGNINGWMMGPDTTHFYDVLYTETFSNGGNYSVKLKNVPGATNAIWIQSIGHVGDVTYPLQVYAKIRNASPWNNAVFAGAAGAMISGSAQINGSVHILGTGLTDYDYAVELGGEAHLIGNNYAGMPAPLIDKIPALPVAIYNGETVSTLNAVLRIKHGKIGLSDSATIGEPNVSENGIKETVDSVYSNDGFGGNKGTRSVYSDNGWSNEYDLKNPVAFPGLNDPYPGYASYRAYLQANALVISDVASLHALANITPNSNFSLTDVWTGKGSIRMDGKGNLVVSGIVYLDDGGDLNMSKAGSNKTITYTGCGIIYVSGSARINVNLLTGGNNSFPDNIIAIVTPNQIIFNETQIQVMGLFYAENKVTAAKQTSIAGTIVSNYFDMGINSRIYQVPAAVNHLPQGLIGQDSDWTVVVSRQKQ